MNADFVLVVDTLAGWFRQIIDLINSSFVLFVPVLLSMLLFFCRCTVFKFIARAEEVDN